MIDYSDLVPSAESIRNTILPVMKSRGTAITELIIDTAVREAIGGATTAAWAAGQRGMDRRKARAFVNQEVIMDLMSVIVRAERGQLQ